jgi:hypothetical protein
MLSNASVPGKQWKESRSGREEEENPLWIFKTPVVYKGVRKQRTNLLMINLRKDKN